jgi:hypothetical protein
MHYKTNRLNHDFQIAYFIAGACQTPDAAYSILCDLKEDRSNAIKSYKAGQLREQAKILRAKRLIASGDEISRLEGEADIAEVEALSETSKANYNAAVAELATINKCIDAVQPYRKFAHLPDIEAHEAAQQEEWKLQLIHTAENYLITSGSIPADHFSTMRMHPEFASEIMPALDVTRMLMASPEGATKLIDHLERKAFDLPKLLEGK